MIVSIKLVAHFFAFSPLGAERLPQLDYRHITMLCNGIFGKRMCFTSIFSDTKCELRQLDIVSTETFFLITDV